MLASFPYYIVRFKRCEQKKKKLRTYCFHTTQCDLNALVVGEFLDKKKFPYYIVRFKLTHVMACSDVPGESGFHTTQCDLNLTKNHFSRRNAQFPYYIVRFKHIIFFKMLENPISFHTTQCDLNYRSSSPTNSGYYVSILHSAI